MKAAYLLLALAPAASAQAPLDASLSATPGRVLAAAPAPSGTWLSAWSDDFNRPGGPLGPDWVTIAGSYFVYQDVARSLGGIVNDSIVHTRASSPYATATASVDILPVASPGFVALQFSVGGTNAVTLKIQDNDNDGLLDTFGFYQDTGTGNPWVGGTAFGPLATPTATCRLTAYFSANGDVAHMDLDHNFDGVPEEQLSSPGLLASGLILNGSSVGVSTWRFPRFDNWSVLDGGPNTSIYCTAKANSLGCVPAIASNGKTSSSQASGFRMECSMLRNNKPGLLFYTVGGTQAATPFQCGTLCVGPGGIRRTPAQTVGGHPPPTNDCSGKYSLDMNAFAAGAAGGNPDPGLSTPASRVNCQFWGRDQGFAAPCNTTLSGGAEYFVGV